MDLQLVGNAFSVAYYICAYMCKSEPDILKSSLATLFKEISNMELPIRNKLMRIGNCVLKKRTLSAQEAAYRLGNLQLIYSSRIVIYLNTLPAHKRTKILRPKIEIDALPEESTQIFQNNILDYYYCRPDHFESLCLYSFASWYKLSTPNDNPKTERAQPRFYLKEPLSHVKMQKRTKHAVIRTPKLQEDSDDYYFSCLLLYLPHRNENQLVAKNQTLKEVYICNYHKFDKQHLQSSVIDSLNSTLSRIKLTQNQLASWIAPGSHNFTLHSEIVDQNYACLSNDLPVQNDDNIVEPYYGNIKTSSGYDEQQIHSIHVGVTMSDLENQIASLNKNQLTVFTAIKNHYVQNIYQNKKAFHGFITGGAGVGKSYLLQVLVDWLRLCTARTTNSDPVILTAPTGIAARNIRGITVHSAFKLPVQHGREPDYRDLSSTSLQQLRKQFIHIHTVVIDEISMISSKTFTFINDRLCAIKDSDEPFGGLNVILFGDLYQLRPVNGHYVFKCVELWHLFHPYFLTQNVRQQNNVTYAAILNRIRLGLAETKNVTILKQKQKSAKELEKYSNLLHIYPTRAQVEEFNLKQQNKLNQNHITVVAQHYFSESDITPGLQAPKTLIPEDDRKAGGLPYHLHLSKHTRVMLLRNLYTEQGLVNGAMGQVQDIEIDDESGLPSVVFVKFNDSTIGKVLQIKSHSDAIAIEQITQEYLYKGRFMIREQFPLIPCWACTIHKVQGLSLECAVISIGNKIFNCGQTYVALSRIKSLDGLHIENFHQVP